jgi:cellulose synthase/poly-beta-1,6-N-acetylglucosamine synthase-like glycosyltransferase
MRQARRQQVRWPDVSTVSFADLLTACRSLRPDEIGPALKHRYLPIRQPGREKLIAATDHFSSAEAERAGLEVGARVRSKDLTLALQAAFGPLLIRRATMQLFRLNPAYSARSAFARPKKTALLLLAALLFLLGGAAPSLLNSALALMACCIFLAGVAFRLIAVACPARAAKRPQRRLRDDELPLYSVLVPLFRETQVLKGLVRALNRLDYPRDRLDIKIILEEEDAEMRRAVQQLDLPCQFETLIVPKGLPQTKPRALAYALYFARGTLATVYDAEDMPEPEQLRQAAEIFAAAPERLACLQARLTFHDPNQNWLTRQFVAEYAALFDIVLPVLGVNRWPVPLGGTSNHFRIDILRKTGGWDPFNVTEDADLGLRLARCGFEVDVFASSTYEEANTCLKNWMRQRRRWIKGWIQTALVHLRSPRDLCAELGVKRFLLMQVLLMGMVISPLLHPFLLGYTLWALASGQMMPREADITLALATGFGMVIFVMGYAAAFACQLKGMRVRGLLDLKLSVAGLPLYWLLISAAAWMAVWEFLRRPYHWNKTQHGFSCLAEDEEGVVDPGEAGWQ